MNTRQKIWNLLTEGKSIDEIEVLLKDEKVTNIRVYIHRVKRDIRLGKKKKVYDKRVDEARGITETRIGVFYRNKQDGWTIDLKCLKCKNIVPITIHKTHMPLYTEEIKTKYICVLCRRPKRKVIKCSESRVSPKTEK